MSVRFTIRISRKLKQKMDENPAEWSREVRGFLEQRVQQKEMLKTLEEIEKRADKRKRKIDSTALIREGRGLTNRKT